MENDNRNTEARNIVAALWWVWHKAREMREAAQPERRAVAGAVEEFAWVQFVESKRMLRRG